MERNSKIRLAYSVFLGVFTVVVGILFLAGAAELYYSGVAELGAAQGMYSREAVGARLLELLAPIALWIVAIMLGVAVYAVFPVADKRNSSRDDVKIYARLRRRTQEEKDPAAFAKVKRMERVRLGVRVFSAAFCLLAAVMCIVYLANTANFTSLAELNSDVLHMVANVLPWVGAALAVLLGEAVFEVIFAKKMLPKVKPLVGAAPAPSKWETGAKKVSAAVENKYVLLGVRCALFVLAAVFIVLGALPANGGAHSVLIKAINICTECIGLG